MYNVVFCFSLLISLLICNLFSSFSQSSESASSLLRLGNLSALKKRWEQAQAKPSSVPPPSQSSTRSRPPALARPAPIPEPCPPLKSPGLPTDQGGQLTAGRVVQPAAAPEASEGEEQTGMDRKELTHRGRPEKLDEKVPTSPCASYEKPRVPLTNLKMKFERGEDTISKVATDRSDPFLLRQHLLMIHLRQCYDTLCCIA